ILALASEKVPLYRFAIVVLRVPQVPPCVASILVLQVKTIPVPNAGRVAPTAATTQKTARCKLIVFTDLLRKRPLVLFLPSLFLWMEAAVILVDGSCRRPTHPAAEPKIAGFDYTIFLIKTLLGVVLIFRGTGTNSVL